MQIANHMPVPAPWPPDVALVDVKEKSAVACTRFAVASTCHRDRWIDERIRTIAGSYIESPEKTLIVSPDNTSWRQLNAVVWRQLKANGTIGSEDHSLRVLVQRQHMTGAERPWTSRYEIQRRRPPVVCPRSAILHNECVR
jgi:hypothetical protein